MKELMNKLSELEDLICSTKTLSMEEFKPISEKMAEIEIFVARRIINGEKLK